MNKRMDIQSIEIGRINVCVVLFCNRYSSSNNVQFSPFDSFHNFPSIRLGSIHNIQDMLGTIFQLTKVSQNSVYSPAQKHNFSDSDVSPFGKDSDCSHFSFNIYPDPAGSRYSTILLLYRPS